MSGNLYEPSEGVQAIFDAHWSIDKAADVVKMGPERVREFSAAMRRCQAALIRYYLPVMDSSRLLWALRTLHRLEGSAA